MKINLLLANDSGLYGGGAENRIRLLLGCLKDIDLLDTAHILCSKDTVEHNRKLKSSHFIKFHFCENDYRSSRRAAARIIKDYAVNLVSAHNVPTISPSVLLAAKQAKIPSVWFAHDYWPLCAFRTFYPTRGKLKDSLCLKSGLIKCAVCANPRAALRMAIFRKILGRADMGIAPSEFIKNLFSKNNVLKGRWRVIKPWIDTKKYVFCGVPEKSRLLFAGPLAAHKGIDVALKALAITLKIIPELKMAIVGPEQEEGNPQRKRINALADKLGILDKLEFAGFKNPDQLKEYYAKAAIYLCPPIWPETFGLNWAEAMACGTTVIASDSGSIPELSQGRIVITASGSSEELNRAILGLLTNPGEELRRRKTAEFAAEEFNVERASRQFAEIFKEIS